MVDHGPKNEKKRGKAWGWLRLRLWLAQLCQFMARVGCTVLVHTWQFTARVAVAGAAKTHHGKSVICRLRQSSVPKTSAAWAPGKHQDEMKAHRLALTPFYLKAC
eukprot:1158276-Pelagomonas_calceolata.AAC.6